MKKYLAGAVLLPATAGRYTANQSGEYIKTYYILPVSFGGGGEAKPKEQSR